MLSVLCNQSARDIGFSFCDRENDFNFPLSLLKPTDQSRILPIVFFHSLFPSLSTSFPKLKQKCSPAMILSCKLRKELEMSSMTSLVTCTWHPRFTFQEIILKGYEGLHKLGGFSNTIDLMAIITPLQNLHFKNHSPSPSHPVLWVSALTVPTPFTLLSLTQKHN